MCFLIASTDDDQQAFVRFDRDGFRDHRAVVARDFALAGTDAEHVLYGLEAIAAAALLQFHIMLHARNAAAPGVDVFKRHQEAAFGLTHNPRHPRARQVGHDAGAAVQHGFQNHDAEGFRTLARGKAEHVAFCEQRMFFRVIYRAQ